MESNFNYKLGIIIILLAFCATVSSRPGKRKDESSSIEAQSEPSSKEIKPTLERQSFSRKNDSDFQNHRRRNKSSKDDERNKIRARSEEDSSTSDGNSDSKSDDNSSDKKNSDKGDRKQLRTEEVTRKTATVVSNGLKNHKDIINIRSKNITDTRAGFKSDNKKIASKPAVVPIISRHIINKSKHFIHSSDAGITKKNDTKIITTTNLTPASTRHIVPTPKSNINTTNIVNGTKLKTSVIRRKVVKINVDPRRINIRPAASSVVVADNGQTKTFSRERIQGIEIITPTYIHATTNSPTTTFGYTSTFKNIKSTRHPSRNIITPFPTTTEKLAVTKLDIPVTTPAFSGRFRGITRVPNISRSQTTVRIPSSTRMSSTSTTTSSTTQSQTTSTTTEKFDFNIDKYVSPEFHDINNVYTQSISPEIAQFVMDDPQDIFTATTTNKPQSLSELLDSKFKEVSEGIIKNVTRGRFTTDRYTTEIPEIKNFAKNVNDYLKRNKDNNTKVVYKTTKEVAIKDLSNPKSIYKDITNEHKTNLYIDSISISTITPPPEITTEDEIPNFTTTLSYINSQTPLKEIPALYEKIKKWPTIADQSTTDLSSVVSKNNASRGTPRKMAITQPRVRISLKNKNEWNTTPISPVTTDEMEKVKFVQLVKMHPYTRKRPNLSTTGSIELDPVSQSDSSPVKSVTLESGDLNANTLRKRGSVKFSAPVPTSMKKKEDIPSNFTVPPTATAWAFATLNRAPVPVKRPTIDNITEATLLTTTSLRTEDDLQKIETTAYAITLPKHTAANESKTDAHAEDNKLVSTQAISNDAVKLEEVPTIRISGVTTADVPLNVIALDSTTISEKNSFDRNPYTSTEELPIKDTTMNPNEYITITGKDNQGKLVSTTIRSIGESVSDSATTEVSVNLDITPSKTTFESITKFPNSITTPSNNNNNIKSAVYDVDFIDSDKTTHTESDVADISNNPNYYDSGLINEYTTYNYNNLKNGAFSNDVSTITVSKKLESTTAGRKPSQYVPTDTRRVTTSTSRKTSEVLDKESTFTTIPFTLHTTSIPSILTYQGVHTTTATPLIRNNMRIIYSTVRPPVTDVVEILNFDHSTENNQIVFENTNPPYTFKDYNHAHEIKTVKQDQLEIYKSGVTNYPEINIGENNVSTIPNSISGEGASRDTSHFNNNVSEETATTKLDENKFVENITEALLLSSTSSIMTPALPALPITTTFIVDTTKSTKENKTEWHYATTTTEFSKEETDNLDPDDVNQAGNFGEKINEYNVTWQHSSDLNSKETDESTTSFSTKVTETTNVNNNNNNIELIKVEFDKNKKVEILLEQTTEYQIIEGEEVVQDESVTAAVIISCIGVIALLAIVALLVVRVRRRRLGTRFAQRCTPVALDTCSLDSAANGSRKARSASKRSYGNPAYDDEVVTSHPMHVAALASFAMDEESMSSEFAEIPTITVKAEEVPQGCENKNRYVNVLPPPETRVPLSRIGDDPATEYINANFVTGPGNEKNYFIITQSPMSNTVTDFWRMIWEHNCRVILMLTEYMENGVEKCYEYIPPSEASDNRRAFSNFHVTLKKKELREKYVVSTLQLRNTKTRASREIVHMWYFWPAKGVPADYESIINFIVESRNYHKVMQTAKEFEDEGADGGIGDSRTELYPRDKNASNGDRVNVYPPYRVDDKSRNGNTKGINSGKAIDDSQVIRRTIRPTVIHCAGGAGRSSAVAAAARCCRELDAGGAADVPRAALRLRRDRPPAIQNKHQYIFVYKVLNEYAKKLSGNLDVV